MADRERDARIIAIVRAIPEGFVRTYGDVAPRTPRLVGRVLSESEDPTVPWWRVVRADGSVTQGPRQLDLLRAEEVPLCGDRVDLAEARFPLPPGELA